MIVDDEELIRQALRVFVDKDAEMSVVGEASNGAQAITEAERIRPDVVLMDIHMPVLDGVNATARLTADDPAIKVLAVTTFSSERHVVAALRAGASGYLVKDTPPKAIIQAVRDAHEGRFVLSPHISRELVRAVRTASHGTNGAGQRAELTPREESIVRLLARGLSNFEIAGELFLAEATVKSNLRRIMIKWDVRDRVQVLIKAAETGVVYIEQAQDFMPPPTGAR